MHTNSITDRIERFWARVDKTDPHGCWIWTGSRMDTGYGTVMVHRKQTGAHRFSWELHCGPIPEGKNVCHDCRSHGAPKDNPSCVNPAHLFLGTQKQNTDDARRKGTMPSGADFVALMRTGIRSDAKGQDHPKAKLKDEDIPVICELWKQGVSMREIARRYGLKHHGAISEILHGTGWRHINAGVVAEGERTKHCKLTPEQVQEIRRRHKPRKHGFGPVPLAKEYGVAPCTIQAILSGKKWAWLPEETPVPESVIVALEDPHV